MLLFNLIELVINPRKGICSFQSPCWDHCSRYTFWYFCPSSLQNKTGTLYGEKLRCIRPLSNSSCSCVWSSFNSVGAILYGALEIGPVSDRNLISKEIFLSDNKPDNFLGKTSTNFCTTGTWVGLIFTSLLLSTIDSKYSTHPSSNNFWAYTTCNDRAAYRIDNCSCRPTRVFPACFVLTHTHPEKLLRRSPIHNYCESSTLNFGVLMWRATEKKMHLVVY